MPMDSSTSSFSEVRQTFPDAELLQVGGTTCECYRVKRYGKLHFLKRLKPELRTHPQYVAALQKEFETGYLLDHPHLVRYVGKTDDGILMDYVDGETLGQFAQHHPDYFRNRNNADSFLHQLLSVVGYLHSHQIVHLDLKPSNILITRIGHDVKLIDLEYCYADCYTDTMGRTDKYAAPEQMDGSAKPDARTDIYAIGRILQTLPCAHYYNKVIRRCTEENPVERYQSIADLETAISKKRPYLLPVGILMIIIVLSVVLFLWNPFLKSPSQSLQHHVEDSSIPVKRESSISQKGVFGDIQGQSSAIEDSPSQQPSLTPQTAIPQQTEAPQNETHSSKSEMSVSEAGLPKADPPVIETQSPSSSYTDADVAQLRRLLHEAIRPIYEKHLGAYRDIDYYEMNQAEIEAYGHQDVAFMEDCMRKHHELWQKYQQQYDKALFADEFEKIRETYDAQVFLPSRNKQ